MAVHHVDMDPVGPGRVDRPHLLAQSGEIGREDRGGNADRLLHGATLTSRRVAGQGIRSTYPPLFRLHISDETGDEEAVRAAFRLISAGKDAPALLEPVVGAGGDEVLGDLLALARLERADRVD